MPLDDIQNPRSVLDAVAEFKRIGRDAFLGKYGFGKAREYYLLVDGERFDSKAILGAAHGYEFPNLGPLPHHQFSGGAATVERKLREFGFTVEHVQGGNVGSVSASESGQLASSLLRAGAIYSREELKQILATQDATINTGVFRPAGFDSVLLFVTKEKTKDRVQFVDRMDGDILYWQGQSKGRTDPLIIEHRPQGLELLVFYREKKYEHPGAGFRFEGRYSYVSHTGSEPADFVLKREMDEVGEAAAEAEAVGAFDPTNPEDARKRLMAAIVRRQGQPTFRRGLLRAYCGQCAISGCQIVEVLEAAHIVPYRGAHTNDVRNGLLLRADLHTLFDLGLIAIDAKSKTVIVALPLRVTDYGLFHGKAIRLPAANADHPSAEALDLHRIAAGI